MKIRHLLSKINIHDGTYLVQVMSRKQGFSLEDYFFRVKMFYNLRLTLKMEYEGISYRVCLGDKKPVVMDCLVEALIFMAQVQCLQ